MRLENYIEIIKDNPVDGVVRFCNDVCSQANTLNNASHAEYDILIEAYIILLEFEEANVLPIKLSFPTLMNNHDKGNDALKIYSFLKATEKTYIAEASKLRIESLRNHYKNSIQGGFCYEFSQGDLDRVQQLINELRDLIAESPLFTDNHRERLLKRLEKLQAELHKKVSDLDRFWGLIGDAGVVMGKFGQDVKPLVDRIKEIADIVWRTQARAEELPSGTGFPMLESKTGDGDTLA